MTKETEAPTLTGTPLFDETAIDSLLSGMADWADCKCESTHVTIECSTTVVGRKTVACHSLHFNICQSSWNYNARLLNTSFAMCPECGRPVSECWSIRPI